MKGPHDGTIRSYHFGNYSSYGMWTTEADSLEKAIRRFRVGALYPHQYVQPKYQIKGKILNARGYTDTCVIDAKPGAKIEVWIHPAPNTPLKHIANISLEDNQDIEIKQFLDSGLRPALEAIEFTSDTKELTVSEGGVPLNMTSMKRKQIEEQMALCKAKMGELEAQKREFEAMVRAMKAEVDKRLKQIWVIELYIGSKEEIVQIAEGENASSTEKIYVFQQVLCMDEEIAVYNWNQGQDPENFDFRDIKDFDRWLTENPEHLEQVLPAKKGIVALRVRRYDKNYETKSFADAFFNASLHDQNKKTYLLIRNGDNLYRIWADTSIWPRMFPSASESNPLKEWEWESDKREYQEQMESYLRGLIVIQGLLDRSHVFSPLPAPKINVMVPEDVEKYFYLVRDDEPALQSAESAHLMSWKDYRKWLQGQVRVGARVIWLQGKDWYSKDYMEYHVATGHRNVGRPDNGGVYIVDQKDDSHGSYMAGPWSFLYLPDETIWVGWDEEEQSSYRLRKKRVRWYCDDTEIVALDAISLRYVSYLVNNRYERREYETLLRVLMGWSEVIREEQEKETPFVELLLQQAGLNPRDPSNEEEMNRARRLIRWWKLKTKETRTLGSDEPKALRMILKEFKKGRDFDDDPEKLLSQRKTHDKTR
jgi:hypothetical protein